MRHYLASLIGFLVFWSVALPLFVVVVDPYGLSPINSALFGFNLVKPGRYGNDRLIKAHDANRMNARTVILGSSRVKQGMNPELFEQSDFGPIYNAGVDNGNLAESKRLLLHYLESVKTLRYAFVELFPINNMAPPQNSVEEISRQSLLMDQLKIYSLSGIGDSLATIAANVFASDLKMYTRMNGFYDVGFPNCRECMLQQFPKSVWREIRFDFGMSERTVDAINELIALGEPHGVEVYFFLSPLHAWTMYPHVLEDTWGVLESIKRRLASTGRVYDFLRYNAYTDEPVNPALKYFPDDYHFSPELGGLVMRALFDLDRGSLPSNWGTLLSDENIENQLEDWTVERDQWVLRNPQLVKEIEAHYRKWIVDNHDVPRWLTRHIRGLGMCGGADGNLVDAVVTGSHRLFETLTKLTVFDDLALNSRTAMAPDSTQDCEQTFHPQWRVKRRLKSQRKRGEYSIVAAGLSRETCIAINRQLHAVASAPRVHAAVDAWSSLGITEVPIDLDAMGAITAWDSGCVFPVDSELGVFFSVAD